MRQFFFTTLILTFFAMPAKAQLTWVDLNFSALQSFNDIDFASPAVGYIVGNDGKILKTVDGGFTWTYQTSTVVVDLFDCEFYDEQTGWACGQGGLVLRTTNGGTTWTPKYILTNDEFHAIDFFSNTTGYVAGKNTSTGQAEIYYTTDGGANFTGIAPPNTISDVTDMVFFDLFNGYILIGSELFYTTNQGFSWTPVILPTTYNMSRLEMSDFTHGFIVGDEGTILTTSTGSSWSAQTSGVNSTLRALAVVDANTLFAGGNNMILTTTNGGVTWESFVPAGLSLITAMDAISAETAWGCGEIGRYTRTYVDSDLKVDLIVDTTKHCPGEPFDLVVNVKNEGFPPVTSGAFEVYKNGVSINSFDWTGNILYNATDAVSLGQVSLEESTTVTVKFNGDDITTNNTLDQTVDVVEIDPYSVNGPFTICPGEEVELTATGGNSYYWLNATSDSTAQTQVVKPATNSNYVVVIFQDDCTVMDTVAVTIGSSNCNTNAFSPNGDGTNDFFYIDHLPEGENLVHIFNRWGDPLLTFTNYDNDLVIWNGEDGLGVRLIEGIYFFTVESKTTGPYSEGWVQIVR